MPLLNISNKMSIAFNKLITSYVRCGFKIECSGRKKKKMNSILKILSMCILLSSNLAAQIEEESLLNNSNSAHYAFKHALNICPVAVVFGFYSINYEYRISPKNGIIARFDYEDVPDTYTDASIESSGVSFILNYRRYLSEETSSLFFGAHTRYRIYDGNGELNSKKFDLTIKSFSIGLNAGKRWVWDNGFNTLFLLGYGVDFNHREASSTDSSIESILDQFEKEYDFLSPFYGEFSIGYSF
jgi:hypothetical protein